MKKIICLLLGAALTVVAGEVPLPGEDGKHAAVTCAPFPDALSAYVWRNWPVVSVDRLAAVIGASRADLEGVAAEMGLPVPQPDVSPLWRRKGYITVVRRNWHLLPYEQLLKVVDMTRAELAYSLTEDDFLFVKLGNTKPLCAPITWSAEAAAAGRARRLEIARVLKEEGIVPMAPEEARFSFVGELSGGADAINCVPPVSDAQERVPPTFDLRLIFSYFADYGDPLGDDEVGSYPEGLLARLAESGVYAVWLPTVLSTLARDPEGVSLHERTACAERFVLRKARTGGDARGKAHARRSRLRALHVVSGDAALAARLAEERVFAGAGSRRRVHDHDERKPHQLRLAWREEHVPPLQGPHGGGHRGGGEPYDFRGREGG